MPTYDYRCAKGHRYEKQEPFGSPSEHPCMKCGVVAKRQLSVPALAFKGSGFYVTDSRKSSSTRSTSDSSSAKSSTPSEGSSSSKDSTAKDSSSSSSSKKSSSSTSKPSSSSD